MAERSRGRQASPFASPFRPFGRCALPSGSAPGILGGDASDRRARPDAESTMKRTPLTIRLATTLTVAALAACGGGGGETTTAAPSASPAPAATPAPTTVAGNAVRGKQIYNDLPNTMLACVDCHGAPINNVSGILKAAGNWQVIALAIQTNKGGMGALASPVLNGFDMQDIAAYLAQPNL
jgi:mono/diheme cytochrome c family protein